MKMLLLAFSLGLSFGAFGAKKELAADRAAMQQARGLFEQEKFTEALEKYDQIPKSSDYWLEAVEEKAWTYHRMKQFDKSLAQTKTLLSQPFVKVIGSEPFFLQSLTALKVCDYKKVLETHALFKETQRTRLIEIQKLADGDTQNAADEILARAKSLPLNLNEMGDLVLTLPRLFYRDHKLQEAIRDVQSQLNKKSAKALLSSKKKLGKRLQELAEIETEENAKILQKINLIEVETIQRVHADQELDQKTFQKGEFKQAGTDQLVFPDDGHPWMDELDKYQVRLNSCPQDLRRKM